MTLILYRCTDVRFKKFIDFNPVGGAVEEETSCLLYRMRWFSVNVGDVVIFKKGGSK